MEHMPFERHFYAIVIMTILCRYLSSSSYVQWLVKSNTGWLSHAHNLCMKTSVTPRPHQKQVIVIILIER